jgi:hypothetical protein
VSDRSWIQFSVGTGLTTNSNPVLLRVGYRQEIEDFGKKLPNLFDPAKQENTSTRPAARSWQRR